MTQSSYDALRDPNRIPVAMGQSNIDSTQTLPFLCDHVTGRVLVDSGGGGGGNNFVYNEILSGSGTAFTFATAPIAGLYTIYARGQKLIPTTDYTVSGANVTTVGTFVAGDLMADYQY